MTEVNTQPMDLFENKIVPQSFQLEGCLRSLDIRFDTHRDKLGVRYISVAGLLIKLECCNYNLLRHLDIQLACCLTNQRREPDAIFRLWCENIVDCLPKIFLKQKIHLVKDGIQVLIADEEKGRLYAVDKERSVSYFCLQEDSDAFIASQGYLLYPLLYNFAKYKNRIMLHGAVLGYENKGVLICGGSGHGKSTLTVSSLLQSCQYVSDDHLILSREEGVTKAWPVYSIASLYESSLVKMPQLSINNRWLKDFSKHVFDLSAYHQQFYFGLPLKCLIFPLLALNEKKPSIKNTPVGSVLTHLIWSTISQLNDRKDATYVRGILDFLKDLPCYRLTLTSDIEVNAQFLKQFVLNEIK